MIQKQSFFFLKDIGGARIDIAKALYLDSQNKEVKPLMGRLFPGKSVKDIMTGKVGLAARQAMDKSLKGQKGGSNKLPPLEGSTARYDCLLNKIYH